MLPSNYLSITLTPSPPGGGCGVPDFSPSNGALSAPTSNLMSLCHLPRPTALRVLEIGVGAAGFGRARSVAGRGGPEPYGCRPLSVCARLAISLTPYGQNPWRGPTPVHYAVPWRLIWWGPWTSAKPILSCTGRPGGIYPALWRGARPHHPGPYPQ